jgi:glutathione S-transferase
MIKSSHKENPHLKEKDLTLDTMITLLDERLTQYPWIHGEVMGILDVSLYGMTFVFSCPPSTTSFNYVLHQSNKFRTWFEKMDVIVKAKLGGEFKNRP